MKMRQVTKVACILLSSNAAAVPLLAAHIPDGNHPILRTQPRKLKLELRKLELHRAAGDRGAPASEDIAAKRQSDTRAAICRIGEERLEHLCEH